MSKIDELIQELCPDGVKWKQLGDICVSLRKGTLKRGQLVDDGAYPVINSGREWYGFYDSYNNEADALIIAARGEYAGFVSYISTKFWAGGLCYPYRSIKDDVIQTKFIYYYLKNNEQSIMDTLVARGSIPAINKSDVDKIQIPLPPLPIQEEIVRILDKFTKLEAELEAELEARKKQYDYYRNQLLTPKEIDGKWFMNGKEVEWKTLDQVSLNISAGGDLPKKHNKGQSGPSSEFPYPIYSNGKDSNALYGYTDSYRIDKEAVTISARGTIGFHTIRKPFFTPIVRLITMIPNSKLISSKYLNYALDITCIGSSGGSIPQLTVPNVRILKIPIPPLSEQERIVSILDRFDALVNDISIGLPAEIEARRKQYEYYRGKLLSFKNIADRAEA